MLWELWDPMADDFIADRRDRFAIRGPPMVLSQKLPYSNVIYMSEIPLHATAHDILKYCLPITPLQVALYTDGTAHVEILKKGDLVSIMLKPNKKLKGAKIKMVANRITSDRSLMAMARNSTEE